ncbi:MAG: hypothetical protein PHQ23_03590 [Candidatus Wallbacteria bacterium]|nr:hypothetical protein [Candidatus Wallbacteria bacterium]
MKYRILSIFFVLTVCLTGADITATLDSSDGSSGFSVRDSDNSEMLRINSLGNLSLTGNLVMNGSAVYRNSDTQVLALSGGAASGSAADIELYGGSHATVPGYMYLDASKHYFRDADASPSMLFVDCANAKVGIGTTTPSATLEVIGTIKATSGSIVAINSAGSSIISANTSLNGGVAQLYLGNTGPGGTNWAINAGNNATGVLGNALGIAEGVNYRLAVTQGGKVGIGTVNPSEALSVAGTVEATAFKGPGIIRQIMSVSPTADTNTASVPFVDMAGMSITMSTGSSLLMIYWDAGIYLNTGNWVVTECLVDGSRVGAAQGAYATVAHVSPIGGTAIKSVASGSHTIKVRWRVDTGTAYNSPTSNPDHYGRTLTVMEITQ